MRKEYLKPKMEYVSIISQEAIMEDSLMDGSMGVEDSIFND